MVATQTSPGQFRRFAFEAWPSFRERAFAHMKQVAASSSVAAPHAIVASDGDAQAVDRFRETLKSLPFGGAISLHCGDFFDLTPEVLSLKEPGVVVFNPPYGRRISGGGSSLVLKILAHLSTHWSGWRIAIAVPKDQIPKPLPKGFSLHPLAHGGLDLSVLTGRM